MKNNLTKKLIWGGVGSLVLVLIVSLGFLVYGRIFSAKISIVVAPSIAKVKIGDREFSSSEEINIQPGEYAVSVSADGFETKTGQLVAKADETSNVHLYLVSSRSDTANWYDEHESDALIMGEIKSWERLKEIDALIEKEPVLGQLPLTVEYYTENHAEHVKYIISFELDDSSRGFYLIMKDYTGEGKEAALKKLSELGMDTKSLKLEYQDFTEDRLNYRAE